MPTPRSPWLLRMLAVLEQEGPQEREALIETAIYCVPPGRAWRHAERIRVQMQTRRNGSLVRVLPCDNFEIQRIGARRIVHEALVGAIRRGIVVETDGIVELNR